MPHKLLRTHSELSHSELSKLFRNVLIRTQERMSSFLVVLKA